MAKGNPHDSITPELALDGFRAMVMVQAIEYNLAGVAKNEPDMIVRFTLHGDGKRTDKATSGRRACA
jgi:hypothetical protein